MFFPLLQRNRKYWNFNPQLVNSDFLHRHTFKFLFFFKLFQFNSNPFFSLSYTYRKTGILVTANKLMLDNNIDINPGHPPPTHQFPSPIHSHPIMNKISPSQSRNIVVSLDSFLSLSLFILPIFFILYLRLLFIIIKLHALRFLSTSFSISIQSYFISINLLNWGGICQVHFMKDFFPPFFLQLSSFYLPPSHCQGLYYSRALFIDVFYTGFVNIQLKKCTLSRYIPNPIGQ